MESLTDRNDTQDAEPEKILQNIKANLAARVAHLDLLNLQRRQVLNDYLDLKGNIRVFCRIRPSLPHESNLRQSAIVLNDSNLLLKILSKRKKYTFDKVFHPHSAQEDVFSEVEPVIKSALDGYNVCIFAYGQTGTGKTFTMEGRSNCPGVVPRAMVTLFDQSETVHGNLMFGFSMLEIYMGQLRDLLVPQRAKSLVQTMPCLSIQMDHNGSIEIENLTEIKVSDSEHVKRLYRFGSRLRSTASTMSNATSSRSHCLIRISITCATAFERRRTTNKIWMVDLGGSERLLKTQARGRRFEEGKAINLSLSALGDVISSLHRKKSHVPYRNSKLTQVLRDSLGEDSKTLMLVHVSSKEEDLSETICSLGFATRVRNIHLGQDAPQDVRAHKEFVMAELLQWSKHLESESQCVIKDIKKLKVDIDKMNEKFKQPGKKETLIDENLEALCLNVEDEKFSTKTSHQRTVKGVSTNLPRFMRPTVCSRRKIRMSQLPESTGKKPLAALKRALSICTEPVTYPWEGVLHPDHASESSTSGLSHIDLKYDVDVATECSHDLSECEIKMIIFPEKEETQNSSKTSENCQTDKDQQEKHLDIDDWLVFQSKDLLNTFLQWNKGVFALPEPGQNEVSSEQISTIINNNIDTSSSPSVRNSCTTRKENNYHCKNINFCINADQECREDMDAKCHQNIESSHRVQNLELLPESETCPTSTPDKSEFGMEYLIFDQAGEAKVLVSPIENTIEVTRKSEDLFESEELVEKLQGLSVRSLRSRRSLFVHKLAPVIGQNDAAVEEHAAALPAKFEEPDQGICHFFSLIVWILYVIIFLGFGSQSLVCSDDFFDGLLL